MQPARARCLPPAPAALPAARGPGTLPGPRPATVSRRTFLLRSSTSDLLLGDFLYQFARSIVVALPGNIRLRDDTDEPAVFFDHGKTAHLVLGHDSQRLIEILLRIDRDNLLGSDFSDGHLLGISPLCDDPNCNIAVGQHPDQFVALHYGCETDILVPHHLRRVRN